MYLVVYALGQFFGGRLTGRFGRRKILLCGMALSVLAAVGSRSSTILLAFLAYATLQSIAQSTGWSAVSKTMSAWFSLRVRRRVLGWGCTHYAAGATAATRVAGWRSDASKDRYLSHGRTS